MRETLGAGAVIASSEITYVEARAALARRHYHGDLPAGDYRRILRDFESSWERYVKLSVTEDLVREAASLAETYRLRAYDAVHLASAVAFRARSPEDVTLATWDQELGLAARREGLLLLPTPRGS